MDNRSVSHIEIESMSESMNQSINERIFSKCAAGERVAAGLEPQSRPVAAFIGTNGTHGGIRC